MYGDVYVENLEQEVQKLKRRCDALSETIRSLQTQAVRVRRAALGGDGDLTTAGVATEVIVEKLRKRADTPPPPLPPHPLPQKKYKGSAF